MLSSVSVPCCHLCDSERIQEMVEYRELPRVTSDCKPWPPGGRLWLCEDCGTFQKLPDESWTQEIQEIYGNYAIYRQSDGAEQKVLGDDQAMRSRSRLLTSALRAECTLPQRGRLLDIGCGNGAFLSVFSEEFPDWKLVGTEFDSKYKSLVESISGVETMHAGSLDGVEGKFQVITIIHALEHIPYPSQLLSAVKERLEPAGFFVINIPEFHLNPFELGVADHSTHFSEQPLLKLLTDNGFAVSYSSDSQIKKERVVIATPQGNHLGSVPISVGRELTQFRSAMAYLQSVVRAARKLREQESFGIFGSSIAATWLSGAISGEFDFFVDGDQSRAGKRHEGKEILSPHSVKPGSKVLMALSPLVAGLIRDKMRGLRSDVEWLLDDDVP